MQIGDGDDQAARDADKIRNDCQHREHDGCRQHLRHDELSDGTRRQSAQRVDLLGHFHRPDFRSDARPHPPAHHKRHHHGSKLADERQRYDLADEQLPTELLERVRVRTEAILLMHVRVVTQRPIGLRVPRHAEMVVERVDRADRIADQIGITHVVEPVVAVATPELVDTVEHRGDQLGPVRPDRRGVVSLGERAGQRSGEAAHRAGHPHRVAMGHHKAGVGIRGDERIEEPTVHRRFQLPPARTL